jgi:hypothetical protein
MNFVNADAGMNSYLKCMMYMYDSAGYSLKPTL